jgi:flagellar basal-body rod modification protein FlgD
MSTIQSNTISNVTQSQQSSASSSIMGKDDFLKLLVMQLQNQDPLNPMEGTEFAAQLAQFSSVEQLSNINSSLTDSINADALLAQSINNALSSTFIGKEVKATSSSFNYTGASDLKLGYTLPSAANTVTVKIYDSSGNLVRTMKSTSLNKGDSTVTWDGKNDRGASVESGKYSFKVEALDEAGTTLATSNFIYGKVSSVRFTSDGTVFVIDGAEIPISDVLEIMEG